MPYLIYLLALIMLAEIAFNGEAPLKPSTLKASLSIIAAAPLTLPLGEWACLLVREASASRVRTLPQAMQPGLWSRGGPTARPRGSCGTLRMSGG